MTDELVEEVARDMWWETHTMPWFAANDGDRSRMLRQARAAIALLRPVLRAEALEEAAKVCDERIALLHGQFDVLDITRECDAYRIAAAAIRALKDSH